MTYVDDRGDQLEGDRSYTLRLDPPPPVGAFWSLTMYDLPNFYLVKNEIGRYSVGDRTPGIVYAADGSLTITLHRAKPADDAVANLASRARRTVPSRPSHARTWILCPRRHVQPPCHRPDLNKGILLGAIADKGCCRVSRRCPPSRGDRAGLDSPEIEADRRVGDAALSDLDEGQIGRKT